MKLYLLIGSIAALVIIDVVGGALLISKEENIVISTDTILSLPGHRHQLIDSPFDPGHGVWSYGTATIANDFWVNSFRVNLESSPAAKPQEWFNPVHQISVEKVEVPDEWCPSQNELIFVSGNGIFSRYNNEITIKPPYAFFLARGTKLKLTVLFHNHEEKVLYQNARMTVTLTGASASAAGRKFRDVKEAVLTPAGCENRTIGHITIPPHVENYKLGTAAQPFIFKNSGKILFSGTHFHPDQGGKSIRLLLNGKPIYEFFSQKFSWAERDHKMQFSPAIDVKNGDILTMDVTHDNVSATPNRNAMAIVGILFIDDKQ